MNMMEYRRVIRELCAHTGLNGWEDVAACQHVEVDGTTVAMLYDEDLAPDTLCLYFDLGGVGYSGHHQRLLEENVRIRREPVGYFCIHPENGSAVYRVNMPLLPNVSGAALFQHIEGCLAWSRRCLQSL